MDSPWEREDVKRENCSTSGSFCDQEGEKAKETPVHWHSDWDLGTGGGWRVGHGDEVLRGYCLHLRNPRS